MFKNAPYRNRRHAGQILASLLLEYRGRDDVRVLALPRGGVPVAEAVADELGAPLDVFLVRKLGVPGYEELAMGAVSTGDVRVLNSSVIRSCSISSALLDAIAARELQELRRRESLYRGERPAPDVQGMSVILVDDGLATGATMRAAVQALRRLEPARIVVAVPIGSQEACAKLQIEADEVICPLAPPDFDAVGAYYEDFSQTSDEEVCAVLASSRTAHPWAHP